MQEDHVIAMVMDFVGSTCQGRGENSQGRELESGCQRAESLSEPSSPDCQFGSLHASSIESRGVKGPRWRFTGQTIKEGVSANKRPDGQE